MIRWSPVTTEPRPAGTSFPRRAPAPFDSNLPAAPGPRDADAPTKMPTNAAQQSRPDDSPSTAELIALSVRDVDGTTAATGTVPSRSADAAVAADATVAPHAQMIGVQVLVAGAVVETLDVPWGLAASGHLAQSSRVDHLLLSQPGRITGTAQIPATANAREALAVSVGGVAGHAARGLSCTPVPGAMPMRRRDEAARAEAAVEAAVVESATPVRDWARQLLRWVERQGEVTVYVRDFRLDDEQVERLSERLHQACAWSGAALPRIIVNGRMTRDGEAAHAR